VIHHAAATDGLFFERAQAGNGFARADNFRVRVLHFCDKGGGEGRDARKMGREIKRDALGGKNGARVA
jgi:hypothetical protein